MPKAALSSARPGLRLSPVSPAGSENGPRLPETDGERKEKIRARNAGCGYSAKKKQVHVWDREQAAVQRNQRGGRARKKNCQTAPRNAEFFSAVGTDAGAELHALFHVGIKEPRLTVRANRKFHSASLFPARAELSAERACPASASAVRVSAGAPEAAK